MFIRYNPEDLYDILSGLLTNPERSNQSKLQIYYLDGEPIIKTNVPAITYTEENYLTVIAEMPGLDKKDISITVEDKTITIKGNVKSQQLPDLINHVAGAIIPKEDYITYVYPAVRYSLDTIEKEYKDGRVLLKFPLDLDINKPRTLTFE